MIRNNLVSYPNNNGERKGGICLFNSYTCSVEDIVQFQICYMLCEVATTQNKVNYYVRYFE